MPVFLSGIAGKLAMGGVLIAALFGVYLYWHSLESSLTAAKANLAAAQTTISTLQAANKANLATIAAQQAQAARDATALAVQAASEAQASGFAAQAQQAISGAPSGSDGTVAPVLANVGRLLAKDQGQP